MLKLKLARMVVMAIVIAPSLARSLAGPLLVAATWIALVPRALTRPTPPLKYERYAPGLPQVWDLGQPRMADVSIEN